MINFDKKRLLKKWAPIILIIFGVTLGVGFLFRISGSQILSAVVITLILIASAFLFQMVGRNRFDSQNGKMGLPKNL